MPVEFPITEPVMSVGVVCRVRTVLGSRVVFLATVEASRTTIRWVIPSLIRQC